MNSPSFLKQNRETLSQGTGAVNRGEGRSDAPRGRSHLIQAAGVVGSMTLISRILGMVRDIVCARAFGTTWQWDAFLYAFMIPNFFRRLVGEGALSAAFIPLYTESLEREGEKEAFRFANVAFTFWTVALLALILAVEGLLELGLRIPGLSPRVALTFDLLRTLFPYLLFVALYALSMGVLNTHRRFWSSSFSPAVLNILWTAGVVWIAPLAGRDSVLQLRALAVVLLVAGFAQFAIQWPQLAGIGFRLRWIWDVFHVRLVRLGKLLLPNILSFAVVQVNLLVDMTLAFFIGPGANSSLWYASRLMQFPQGVIGIAMETALLPTVSQQAAATDLKAAKETISFALRSVFLVLIPCTVGLVVLRAPIVQLLFERGAFDAGSTARTSIVLLFYALGLFFISGQKMVAAGFYAVQDTRTPVRMAVVALIANLFLNLALIRPFGAAGLALATSLASTLQFGLLLYFYHRRVTPFPFGEVLSSWARILAAALSMAVLCSFTHGYLLARLDAGGTFTLALRVFGSIFISVFGYLFFCVVFRVREVREAWEWMVRKGRAADAR